MEIYRVAINYKLESRKFKVKSENRSYCDYCGKQLHWYENVPVVSWIIQNGKTRCCDKKLPILYPIVELLTGLLFLLFVETHNYASLLIMIIGLIMITMLVFSAIFDVKYMILPDFSTGILIIAAIILMLGGYGNPPLQMLLSGLGASGFLLALNLITKGKGMGMGDVKLALFMGLLLGPVRVVMAFYIAFIVGAVISLVLIILKKVSRKSVVPFGPFLILGTVVAWFLDSSLVNKMINLIR